MESCDSYRLCSRRFPVRKFLESSLVRFELLTYNLPTFHFQLYISPSLISLYHLPSLHVYHPTTLPLYHSHLSSLFHTTLPPSITAIVTSLFTSIPLPLYFLTSLSLYMSSCLFPTGRSSGIVNDKIFVAAGSEVKGYSKKGNNFLTLDTNLAESLQSM